MGDQKRLPSALCGRTDASRQRNTCCLRKNGKNCRRRNGKMRIKRMKKRKKTALMKKKKNNNLQTRRQGRPKNADAPRTHQEDAISDPRACAEYWSNST